MTYNISSINTLAYIKQKKLAELTGMSLATVRSRVEEIRSQQGKRYPKGAVIDDENLVFVNILAFFDWLNVRQKISKTQVEPFDAGKMAELMGFTATKE